MIINNNSKRAVALACVKSYAYMQNMQKKKEKKREGESKVRRQIREEELTVRGRDIGIAT